MTPYLINYPGFTSVILYSNILLYIGLHRQRNSDNVSKKKFLDPSKAFSGSIFRPTFYPEPYSEQPLKFPRNLHPPKLKSFQLQNLSVN